MNKFFKNYSILYIEKDEVNYIKLEKALINSFKNCFIARNAEDGLKLFKKYRPFIVISELELLNTMDTFEMIKEIKKIDDRVFLVAINSYNNTDKLIEAINIGFDKYLLKPFKLSTLFKILSEIVYILEQEKKLRISQERLKLALEGAGDGLWDWNIKTGEVYYSTRWFEILGYKKGELNYKFETFKKVCHPEDFKKVIETTRNNLAKKLEHYEIEHRMITKNNQVIWILDRGKIIFNILGKPIRMVGHITDITDRKTIENVLYEKTQLLEELNQNLENRVTQEVNKRRDQEQLLIQQSKMAAMGEMIGAIAHQWKQPLNVLSLLLQDLEEMYEYDELNSEKLENAVNSSMKQIDFMSETVNDFRDFFKPSKEKFYFSLKVAINEIYKLLLPQFKNHYIDVEIKGEDLSIKGFPNEFKQVILNVLNNAKDAIDDRRKKSTYNEMDFKGKIDIELSTDGKSIFIAISDNGGGIDGKIQTSLFNPYVSTKGEAGTGIGLYMSKTIIETNMQGKIYFENIVESSNQIGAKFIIELPKEQ